jgi:triacylglycerol esterase/lipase EstA (alpha/beta hydrolase family)
MLNRLADYIPSILGRVIHWIHALVFEAFAVLAVFLLHPLKYLISCKLNSAASGRPILLVHGYLHDYSAWVYQSYQLKAAGFGPIYMLNLGHPFRSIRSYAERIGKLAEKIERETKRKDLILIGHSMGGVVCVWYATQIAPSGKVTDVITMGSPLAGTVMARIAIGLNAREMEQKSPLVVELQQRIAASEHIRFYHIATRVDQVIFPYTSAFVGNNVKRQLILDDIGHVALLFSSRVSNKIKKWLKTPSN